MPNKLVSAADAARLVRSNDAITTSGFVGIGVPDELLAAIAERYADEGAPAELTLVFAAGQGDGAERGLNRLAADGLLKRVVGGHWGLIPAIGRLALDGRIEAYNLPQGVISQSYRDSAAGAPGRFSKIGLETFVDPRNGGGKINDATTDDLVSLTEIDGEETLFYRAPRIDVALLRGTTADERGAITMEREALVLDNLAQAMAAKNNGGVVIVQVERLAARGALNPRDVVLPPALVDAVVIAAPERHMQTYATAYSATFANRHRAPARAASAAPLDARKIIARRAAFELPINGVVNLGIGMPEGVATVADEEGLIDHVTLTAEPGVIGGRPASGLDFGAAENTDAVIPQASQFDFYDGGGLDMACLGMAELDAAGNVNVSRFGSKLAGAGGFINISQSARRVVFAGALTSGGLRVRASDGRLTIDADGRAQKLVEAVRQVTFSGARAARLGQPVMYVTERCVFELAPDGLRLAEVAPGVDIETDIVAHMGFRPIVDGPVAMDARIFRDGPMDLRKDLLRLDLEHRIALEQDSGRLFINLEKIKVRSLDDVAAIRSRVETALADHPNRVDVVVNYDGARFDEDVVDAYAAMVRDLEQRRYARVARYSGSAFMRLKLERAFGRAAQPHIYETAEDARRFLGQDQLQIVPETRS